MRKSILILLMVLCLSFPLASAVSINDTYLYYGLDEQTGTNIIDLTDRMNATAYNTPSNWSGIIKTSYNWTSTTQRIISNDLIGISGSNARTLSLWTYWNGTGSYVHFAGWGTSNTNQLYALVTSGSGTLYFAGWGSADYDTNTAIPLNTWTHLAVSYDGSRVYTYVNGAPTSTTGLARSLNTLNSRLFIGTRFDNDTTTTFRGGALDEVSVWNRNLTASEINDLYNYGLNGTQYPFAPPPPLVETNISFNARNNITNAFIQDFEVEFDTLIYNTSNGTINTNITLNLSSLYNFTYNSYTENGGYYSRTYLNQNITSVPFTGYLDPFFYLFGVDYSNFTTYSGNDYVRLLSYEYNYTCPSHLPTNRSVYIDGSLVLSSPLTCNNVTNSITRTYDNPTEGSYNIIVGLLTNNLSINTTQETFISDLIPPTITFFNTIIPTGFSLNSYNVSVTCQDTIAPLLTYNLTRQSTNIYVTNETNNTNKISSLTAIDGLIPLTFGCSDLFSTSSQTISRQFYYKNISIINEKTGALFPPSNLTSVKLILQSDLLNQTLDLKALGVSSGMLLTNISQNIRLELEYSDGAIITRDLNSKYIESNASICANTDPTTHTEQFIISVTQKPAIVRSNLHNCYVLADDTRFAFQNNFMAKYYTIPTLYNLLTLKNGEESLLASIDGGTSTTINLDTLSFGSTLFNVNFQDAQVMVRKHPTSNTTLIIFYYNPKQDNEALDIQIYYNNTEYFATSTTSSPNNITINFNYLTLNVPEDAIFKIVLTQYKEDGKEKDLTTYYSLSGSTGSFPVALAFVLALLVFISLLTIVSPAFAFGYFGILTTLTGIFILALSPSAWYSNLFIGVFIIIGIYQFLQYQNTNIYGRGVI